MVGATGELTVYLISIPIHLAGTSQTITSRLGDFREYRMTTGISQLLRNNKDHRRTHLPQ
jgi:hypothetical protein